MGPGGGGDGGDGWLPSAVDGAGKTLYLDNAKALQIQRDAKNERDLRRAYDAAERYGAIQRKRNRMHARRAGSPEPVKKKVSLFQMNLLNSDPIRKGDPDEVDRYFTRLEQPSNRDRASLLNEPIGSEWKATLDGTEEAPESVKFETEYYHLLPGGDRRRNSRSPYDRPGYWYYETDDNLYSTEFVPLVNHMDEFIFSLQGAGPYYTDTNPSASDPTGFPSLEGADFNPDSATAIFDWTLYDTDPSEWDNPSWETNDRRNNWQTHGIRNKRMDR
tara:strand:- start:4286 stop:5107 length:822 start_codon:yes stop_codon:yes gene_type:complete